MKNLLLASTLLVMFPLSFVDMDNKNKLTNNVVEEENDFITKEGYAEKYDATYLGNNYYLGSDDNYYRVSYNNLIEQNLHSWKTGHYYNEKAFGQDVKKVVVKNNHKHDSMLKAREHHYDNGILNPNWNINKSLHFGENTPTDDYDVWGYDGDGDTSDNVDGKDWIFYPYRTKDEETIERNIGYVEIKVGVTTTHISTLMSGGELTKDMYNLNERRGRVRGEVKYNKVYYDVVYAVDPSEINLYNV